MSKLDRVNRDCPMKLLHFTDEETKATPIVEVCYGPFGSGCNTGSLD